MLNTCFLIKDYRAAEVPEVAVTVLREAHKLEPVVGSNL